MATVNMEFKVSLYDEHSAIQGATIKCVLDIVINGEQSYYDVFNIEVTDPASANIDPYSGINFTRILNRAIEVYKNLF